MCEDFSEVMRLVEQVFDCGERNVASFLAGRLGKVCDPTVKGPNRSQSFNIVHYESDVCLACPYF